MMDSFLNIVMIVVIGAAVLLLGGVKEVEASGCNNASAKCVEVEFPTGKGRPKVDNKEQRVHKTQDGKISFGFDQGAIQKAYIVFKCQDEETQPNDCRTPLKGGKWVVKLQGGGSPGGKAETVEINSTLERCDLCANVDDNDDYEECVQNACRYPYMILDTEGNRPPLDPDVIVDPK